MRSCCAVCFTWLSWTFRWVSLIVGIATCDVDGELVIVKFRSHSTGNGCRGDDVYDSYVNLSGTFTVETAALRRKVSGGFADRLLG
jgi:hypothetical protein